MDTFYTSTKTPDDWGKKLARPGKQWKKGFSARTLAYSWETAKGFPPEVNSLFALSGVEAFRKLEILFAFPEYKVILLPRSGHPSQNDLFVLAKGSDGNLVSITVEGKVSEKFGDETVGQWKQHITEGKSERWKFLLDTLELSGDGLMEIRYQLFHRLASAVLEAKRFNANYAAMIIHSFSEEDRWFNDYAKFISLYKVKVQPGQLVRLPDISGIAIYSGWAHGDLKFLSL
jgi:hypothetical protein